MKETISPAQNNYHEIVFSHPGIFTRNYHQIILVVDLQSSSKLLTISGSLG